MGPPVTRDFAYDPEVRGLPAVVGVLVAMLAACDPPGLTLEITTTNKDVRSVEILVGMDCSGDCPRGIAPPALAPRAVDRIFVVDDDSPWSSTVDGGVAGFRLAADSATEVDLVLAVGLDEAGTPIETAYAYDVEVPGTRGDYVRVELEAAMPVAASLTEPPPPAGTEALAIWREPNAKRACVLAEHWSDGAEPTRDLVVPVDDPDCDEVVNECAPWTHLATNVPTTIDHANCTYSGALSSGKDVCLLGGSPCNEVGPTVATCAALDVPYCAPQALCSACQGPWNPDCALTAMRDGSATNTMPHLSCTFAKDDAGEPCLDEAIVTGVDGSALLGSPPATTCKGTRVHDLQLPLGPFESSVQTGVGLFKVDGLEPPCTVDVHFKGIPQANESTAIALVDLELDNDAHLAVPAVIHVTTGCTFSPTCTFVLGTTTDSMIGCAEEAPPPTAACGPSGGCPAGPACGPSGSLTCCGSGERCVSGQCICGSNGGCSGGDQCAVRLSTPDQCGELCCGVSIGCPF
jgi:hypothetical protein